MLQIYQSNSADNAKSYYSSGLDGAHEYYAAGVSGAGKWFGKAAVMLGLQGEVQKEQFFQLCDNRRPDDGQKLNPRDSKSRKTGYDITFSAPKSVSLAQSILGDDRIIDAFQASVRETMRYIEQDAHVRVRKDGAMDSRKTSNLVWAEFTHYEARPIDGVSDPQLHSHCYTFNTSYDEAEGKFKASEFFFIKRDALYFEAIFHSKLAGKLQQLGYVIENKPYSFEIAGIGDSNLKAFSRRTAEIEALAEELGIAGNKKAFAKLGAASRQGKKQGLQGAALMADWKRRFDYSEVTLNEVKPNKKKLPAKQALNLAIKNMLERKSVVSARRLVANAMQLSLGDCGLRDILNELKSRTNMIARTRDGVGYITTHEIIAEEKSILAALENERYYGLPLDGYYRCRNDLLDKDQKSAVEAILRTGDRVICIQGRAGTGKTSMMQTAIAAMERCGVEVFTFAPTAQAAHQVLKAEGFVNSDTVQQLLVNQELQSKLRNHVMWVDEAGLLSVREMNRLLQISKEQNCRVVLGGDSSQHHSVERGDAFRLVCESGLVQVKTTRTIYRQRKEAYRAAIQHISNDNVALGLEILDGMGAIIEISDFAERVEAIAEEYVNSREKTDSVLVVSPTRMEGALITQGIRQELKAARKIGREQVQIPVYRQRNLTEAEQSMSHFYEVGSVVRFHRKVAEFCKGEAVQVCHKDGDKIFVASKSNSELVELDLNLSKHYQLCNEVQIKVSVGEQLRLNRNCIDLNGKRLFNGNAHKVTSITRDKIELDNFYKLRADCGVLDYGYVTTSHSGQGKTADKVILSQSNFSIGAASKEQFYVSASRGRDAIAIFTGSKPDLLETVSSSDARMHGIELEYDAHLHAENQQTQTMEVL